MFIIITGTRASGKRTTQEYFVRSKGFEALRLLPGSSRGVGLGLGLPQPENGDVLGNSLSSTEVGDNEQTMVDIVARSSNETTLQNSPKQMPATPASFLSFSSSFASPLDDSDGNLRGENAQQSYSERIFEDSSALLNYVTSNWRSNFVTLDITTRSLLEHFAVRPFVLVLSLDAPVMIRFNRCLMRGNVISLDKFVEEHDANVFGSKTCPNGIDHAYLSSNRNISYVNVINSFTTLWTLHDHLESLDIMNPERLRPGWDVYFMTLASLASHRSNCMKRRVGAILVRENRIVSTGYNGTPRGVPNCNQGGCRRCNQPDVPGLEDECLCLHAEENALLEAGRERVGKGAVLYCNTCPCLKCTIKIVQLGVTEVVYNFSYKMDASSATLFMNAGVKLRQFSPPT